MTDSRKNGNRDKAARWVCSSIITLGLAALMALSFHSANSSFPGSGQGQAGHGSHAAAVTRDGQRGTAADLQARPSPARDPGAATRAAAADAVDPANREQTSLEAAASREHPNGFAPAAQGPPPQLREKATPSQVFGDAVPGTGGCMSEYGDAGQCLPVVPPSLARHVSEMRAAGQNPQAMEHPWSCSEVRKYFRDGLMVRQRGTDPQNLDTNSDGKACAAGDR